MTKYEYMKDYYKFTNWRFVGSSNTAIHVGGFRSQFVAHKRGIWVIMDTYNNSCFIYDMTVEEFLHISKGEDYRSFVDHYWDRCNVAHCLSCNGAGKIDWISRITGPQPFEKIRHKYARDKSKIITFKHKNFLKDYMFAPTKIFKGERMCKDCMGTGMYINKTDRHNLILYDINDIDTEDDNGNKMESC